jgi:hypothetical protein
VRHFSSSFAKRVLPLAKRSIISIPWSQVHTSLAHELGDNSVERGASITESLLAGAQGTEVLSGFWDDVSAEFHDDAA